MLYNASALGAGLAGCFRNLRVGKHNCCMLARNEVIQDISISYRYSDLMWLSEKEHFNSSHLELCSSVGQEYCRA